MAEIGCGCRGGVAIVLFMDEVVRGDGMAEIGCGCRGGVAIVLFMDEGKFLTTEKTKSNGSPFWPFFY